MQLLLLPASGIKERPKDYFSPSIITVRKDDLEARDELLMSLLSTSFMDPDKVINPKSARLIVSSGTEGSIRLTSRGVGAASPERVSTKGIRHNDGKTQVLNHGIDDETVESFEVDMHIGFLAAAFDQTENISAIYESGVPVTLSREALLEGQNAVLRRKLAEMLMVLGFSEEEADVRIERDYPTP
jgi:hypothetical protein